MNSVAKRLWLLGVFLVFWGDSAQGFWFSSARITPTGAVPAGTEIKLAWRIVTPSIPGDLYQPTEVTISGKRITVRVHPTSGVLQAIGLLSEDVSLGPLPWGEYDYEIEFEPPFYYTSGRPTPYHRGRFSLQPPLTAAKLGSEIHLSWPKVATNYGVQATVGSLSEGRWAFLTNTPGLVDSDFVLTHRPADTTVYYRLKQISTSPKTDAYSIDSVTVRPQSGIPLGAEASLDLSLITPRRHGFLYRATEVKRSGNRIWVHAFPGSGTNRIAGQLWQNVSLGVLPPGRYDFEVQLHPLDPADEPLPYYWGSFGVAPVLKIEPAGNSVVLRWPRTNPHFEARWSDDPSLVGQWTVLPSNSAAGGAENEVTNRISDGKRFFRLEELRLGPPD